MRARALLLVVTAGLLVAADGKDDVKKERDKFVGSWDMVKVEVNGKPRPDEKIKAAKMIFTADKMKIMEGERKAEEAVYKLDPAKKLKEIDLTPETGVEAGQTMQGIYELDGDNLKLCFGRPGTERPKEFSSKEGSSHALVVLKRAK